MLTLKQSQHPTKGHFPPAFSGAPRARINIRIPHPCSLNTHVHVSTMLGGMYGGMGMGGLGMGGLGMGGGMYGMGGGYGGMGMGGLGMGGGMYGSSGMYGGSSGMYGSGMYGGGSGMGMMGSNGGLLGNNGTGLLGNGDGTTNGGLLGPNGQPSQQQQGSLLPVDGNNAASPINQHAAPLPPLNETPEEKGRRVRAEHRKERQLIKQQREQRKQIRMQARMEIAGHLTNVLVQTLRSTMEMFAVCFGTYYSMKAVRAFANSQEAMSQGSGQFRRGPMGQMIPVNGNGSGGVAPTGATTAAVTAAAGETAKPSRWKTWLLFGALFLLGEVLYTAVSRSREGKNQKRLRSRRRMRVTEDEFGNLVTHDEMGEQTDSMDSENAMSLYTSSDSEAMASVYRSNAAAANGGADVPLTNGAAGGPHGNRRLYVAAFDHEAEQPDGGYLSFKAGDEFIVEDFVEGSWCEAIPVGPNSVNGGYAPTSSIRGLVPSNFLRPLENTMKL